MKKLVWLLIVALLFSTASASSGMNLEDMQKMREQLYAMMGYETDPSFEINGFNITFIGGYKTDSQDADGITISGSIESISMEGLDPATLGAKEEYLEEYGVEMVTMASVQMLLKVYEEYNAEMEIGPDGIYAVRFTSDMDYAGAGMMFIVHGLNIVALSVVVSSGYFEETGEDMDQYLLDKMDLILSNTSLAA